MQIDGRPTQDVGVERDTRNVFRRSSVTAFVQPIMELSSGRIVGFEALARLRDGNLLLFPDQFLPDLSESERIELFCEMLRQAHEFMTAERRRHPDLLVSVNVETSILMRGDLADLVGSSLGTDSLSDGIYLELLETEKIVDFEQALANLIRLKKLAIGLALDDVGSAYSSLIMLKRLPIDVIKLDQAFARELGRNPSDLQFVRSMMFLARGLGKKLVVEGIETPEILDAITVLGVQYGQGYAIAKPMAVEHAAEWLLAHRERKRSRDPESLLGCYAAHLNVVDTCRMAADQSLPIRWDSDVKDPSANGIGVYLDRCGLHDTPYGAAHRAFHAGIEGYSSDPDGWEQAAEKFRCGLQAAILAGSAKGGRDPTRRQIRSVGGRGFSLPARSTTVTEAAEETSKIDRPCEQPALPADLFFQIAAAANDVIIVTTPDLEPPGPSIVYVNPAFTRLTGYSAAEAIGHTPRILQRAGTDRATLDAIRAALREGRIVHEKVLNFGKGGARYWLDLRIVPLRDGAGNITHFAAIERDVTMDKRRLDELEMAADRDALTGIPNRRALLRVIESEIAAMRSRCIARPDGKDACLAFIDVDHFKNVNDAHGHAVGDAVLIGMADRLTENLRRSDTLGRIGGEEFALWMPGVTLRDATDLADRLRRVVADEPFDTPVGPVTVSVSVGVTTFQPIDNLVRLMQRADTAMYSAKRAGRNRVTVLAAT